MRRLFFIFLSVFAFLAVAYPIKSISVPKTQAQQVCSTSPVDVVLVIDRSGSMTDPAGSSGTKIQAARQAARRFINIVENSNGNHHIGIASYASYGSLDQRLSNNYQGAINAVNGLSAGGDTCIECGIYRGNFTIRDRGRAGSKKIVILLTDGRANVTQNSQPALVSETTAENAALSEATRWNGNEGTIYYTIGLGNNINRSFLRDIAGIGTGGRFYDSPTTDELENIFERIADEILATGSISGVVFEDGDGDGVLDPDEPGLTPWNVELVKPNGTTTTVTTDATGRYIFTGLCSGTYEMKQIVEAGYTQTRPFGAGGYTLNVTGSPLLNYNFGNVPDSVIPPPPSWIQSTGGDVRDDHGTRNLIPGANYFSESDSLLSHGVVFLRSAYNLGAPTSDQSIKANSSFWLVSGIPYSVSVIKTSYIQVLRSLTRGGVYKNAIQLFGGSSSAPCRGNAGPTCDLNTSLAQGVYISEVQNVTISTALPTYRFQPDSKYIFLIKNDLNIKNNIEVPSGSSVIFIIGGDINIASNVTRIDGIFSTDNDFSVESNPAGDEQLLINGNVIANASLKHRMAQIAGSLKGERNLDTENGTLPGIQVKMRPDFILNAPELIRTTNFNRQEVAPGE